jgi:dGTPase
MKKTIIDNSILQEIKNNNLKHDDMLANYATKNSEAIRYVDEKDDLRPSFFHDTDRIMYSKSYTRYIDKTQVFYLCENDHLTHRVLHVQLVSKIARTIGRIMQCNEDLIEAIALGHDVGHTPFGHDGEQIVSKFCQENKVGCFCHNVQSFRQFYELENKAKGINLCVQVLDGIICHNGEMVNQNYKKNETKDKQELLVEYEKCLEGEDYSKKISPMTLEGCIVRVSDVIAYIGRDIEDAITVKLIKRRDIPKEITDILGHNNKTVINTLIIDIINNSFNQESLSFSDDVFSAFQALKEWNNANIYQNPLKTVQDTKIIEMFKVVLSSLLNWEATEIVKRNYNNWLENDMSSDYVERTEDSRKVADYVSGMTDDFLLWTYNELIMPKSFGFSFDTK